MGISGIIPHGNNYPSTSTANTGQVAETREAKFSETKAGKKVDSFLKSVKKICNTPVKLVRNHPKITIAAGLVTAVIGCIAVNPPAMGIGFGLLAAGVLAQNANRHAELREAVIAGQHSAYFGDKGIPKK